MISEPERAIAEPQPVSLNQQSEEQQPQMISVSASEPVFPQTEVDSRAVEPELISAESQLGEGAAGEISDAPRDAEPVLAESGYVQEAQVSERRSEDLQATPAVEEAQVFLSGPDDLEMQTQTVIMGPARVKQPSYDARSATRFAPALQGQGVQCSTMRSGGNSRLMRRPIFTYERMLSRIATFSGVIATGLLLGLSAHRLSPLP